MSGALMLPHKWDSSEGGDGRRKPGAVLSSRRQALQLLKYGLCFSHNGHRGSSKYVVLTYICVKA
jgi:hypothetical protein